MLVTPGTRFGIYEVVQSLGSGGMGEVYRARDSRLRRDVALKVLAVHHRLDPDRQARFAREALALAALNHPNIATVYGVEDAAGVQALVMELVDGETLAERIDRADGGLPVAEVVAIAGQLVDALEAAHDRAVVHRDLKPANVKIRRDGVVKVLDFGLAKALASADVDAATVSMTAVHTVLGTPAYMSPEQARGQDVDQRTDIWAFGCVLYEMLTGRRAFAGATSSDVLAAVLEREPDYDQLPAHTPLLLRRLVKRCLHKDARRRLRNIADARLDLDDATHVSEGVAVAAAAPRRSRPAAVAIPMLVAALIAAATTWVVSERLRPRAIASSPQLHVTVSMPPGVSVTRGPGKLLSLALSPDGRTLVAAGSDSTGERLYKRTLDQPEATPLDGTESGMAPFFSPDGAWVGFFANRRMKRVPIEGGTAIDIAAAPGFPAGASWGSDNRIVFAGFLMPLRSVAVGGGPPEDVLPLGPGAGHLFPEILPDGRTVLFNEGRWINAIDLVSKRRTDRIIEGLGARYSSDGRLLVTLGTTALSAPFDAAGLKVTGPIVPVVEGVDIDFAANRSAYLASARQGTLAYVPAARRFSLVLVEANGTERVLAEQPFLENPRFSPDGRRLVVAATRAEGEPPELWVHDLRRALPAFRLTFGGGRAPVWTRDGASVTYSKPLPTDGAGIYVKSADGNGEARQIAGLREFHWLVGWTPTQTLLYGTTQLTPLQGAPASSIVAITGNESSPVVGPSDTWGGRISPDGRWLAYYSRESGYFEIYVTRLSNAGAKSLIAEGTDPAWSPDGTEIYYRSGSRLMAARVDTSANVRVVSRRLVYEPFLPPLYDDYDIHPDGRTLVLVRPAGEVRGREIAVLMNWQGTMERAPSR